VPGIGKQRQRPRNHAKPRLRDDVGEVEPDADRKRATVVHGRSGMGVDKAVGMAMAVRMRLIVGVVLRHAASLFAAKLVRS
jgi:hypothetical protein